MRSTMKALVFLAAMLLAMGLFAAQGEELPKKTVSGTVYAKDLPDRVRLFLNGDTELITTGAAGKTITRIEGIGHHLTISGTASNFTICNDNGDWGAIRTAGLTINSASLVINNHFGPAILMDNEGDDVVINCGRLHIYSEGDYGIESNKSSVYVYGGYINVNVKGLYGIYGRNVYLYGGNVSLQSSYTAVRSSAGNGLHCTLAISEPAGVSISTDNLTFKDSHNNTAKYVVLTSSSTSTLYTVTFDRNGHGTAPISQKIWKNGFAARPADPVEESYSLVYWVTSLTYKNPYQYTTPITEDKTLYGLWELHAQGSFGGSVTWRIDGEYMTVEGSGPMASSEPTFDPIPERNSIRFVTIQSGITSIASGVFTACGSLETVSIPNTVKYIGEAAFQDCEKLKEIHIPVGCRIDTEAFSDCYALRILRIPTGAQVGDRAFANCYGIWVLQLPEDPHIGSQAFHNCDGLSKVLLPGAEHVQASAFTGCDSLTIFCPPGSSEAEKYAKNNGYTYAKPTVLTLPAKLTSLSAEAFAGNKKPLLIKPLNQGMGIDDTAFLGCPNIMFVGLTGDGGEIKNWCLKNGYIFLLEDI